MMAIRKFLNVHGKREKAKGKPSKLKVTMKDFRKASKKIKEQKKSEE